MKDFDPSGGYIHPASDDYYISEKKIPWWIKVWCWIINLRGV